MVATSRRHRSSFCFARIREGGKRVSKGRDQVVFGSLLDRNQWRKWVERVVSVVIHSGEVGGVWLVRYERGEEISRFSDKGMERDLSILSKGSHLRD